MVILERRGMNELSPLVALAYQLDVSRPHCPKEPRLLPQMKRQSWKSSQANETGPTGRSSGRRKLQVRSRLHGQRALGSAGVSPETQLNTQQQVHMRPGKAHWKGQAERSLKLTERGLGLVIVLTKCRDLVIHRASGLVLRMTVPSQWGKLSPILTAILVLPNKA